LQDVLSNTIEEKALEMLKNVLSKFTENGDKETKSGKKGNKKRSLLKKKNTEENFLSNLIKNLNNKI